MAETFDSRRFYDELGEREWGRMVAGPAALASLEVHRRFLARFVKPGDTVLEIGAGPGRFTLALAELGARVHVTDYSPVQLELHRRHIGGTHAESSVIARDLLDIRDVSRLEDGTFDVVLAYGGPLSYAFDVVEETVRGLLRITRPGGVVLASVMSLLGSWRNTLPNVLGMIEAFGEDANDAVLRTGDLRFMPTATHQCLMFRSAQLRAIVEAAGGQVEAMSASNWASLADAAAVETLAADPGRWARFLEHEVAACAEPGALDGGTHLLVAATRTSADHPVG